MRNPPSRDARTVACAIRISVGALVLATVACLATPGAVRAQELFSDLRIGRSCRTFLEQRVLDNGNGFVLGHLYYAEDSATNRSACGWSNTSPWQALNACQRQVEKDKLAAVCLPVVRHSVAIARSYADAMSRAEANDLEAAGDPLRCGQEPGDRWSWLERGYCDLPRHGPGKAQGVIIWNHGIAGTIVQHKAPPAHAMRMLQTRGWDVIAIKRHNLGENAQSYHRGEERTLEEVRAQRALGYKKVVVAGQSFGGRVALEVARATEDIFAIVAMAPGMETLMGNTRDQGPTDQRLAEAKAERLVVVYPAHDTLFGSVDRGRTSRPILARRGKPYLLFDESAGLRGHGGGGGATFALRYGLCLARFLSTADVPAGRFECNDSSDVITAVRELLPPRPPVLTPADSDAFAGTWYGLLGETLVAVSPVRAPGSAAPGVLYRSVSASNAAGVVYPMKVEHGVITFTLSNKSTITMRPATNGPMTVTWQTAQPGQSNFSSLTSTITKLEGDFQRLPD